MIKSVAAQLILEGDLASEDLLVRLLDAFEGDPVLAPTHWGRTRDRRVPYDRAAVLAYLKEAPREDLVPMLRRLRGPGYEAHWYSPDRVLSSLHVDSRGRLEPDEPSQLFEATSRLATKLPVEFGHVDLQFEGQDPVTRLYRGGSATHLRTYGEKGPSLLFARNYFGPRLVELMGGNTALKATGCPLRVLDGGVVQLDLVERPWESDPVTLKDAQNYVLAVLRSTGVFTQAVGPYSEEPGPKWAPLLGDAAIHEARQPFG